jgi:AcrR family transcriptional regulator
MEKRQAASSDTRARILEAARQLLSKASATDLSMDAIARGADVSRLTIYYQFESRAGLLEALYEYLATRGNMHRMAEVFQQPDLPAAVAAMVRTFAGFWASDPVVMRRLRAMAALDPEIAKGIHARDGRRPHIASEILKRSAAGKTKQVTAEQRRTAEVLGMLTSFESYDVLARAGHPDEEIVATLTSLAQYAMESIARPKAGRAQASHHTLRIS